MQDFANLENQLAVNSQIASKPSLTSTTETTKPLFKTGGYM